MWISKEEYDKAAPSIVQSKYCYSRANFIIFLLFHSKLGCTRRLNSKLWNHSFALCIRTTLALLGYFIRTFSVGYLSGLDGFVADSMFEDIVKT